MTELEKHDFVMDILYKLEGLQFQIYGIDQEILNLDAKDEINWKLREIKTVISQNDDEFVTKHEDDIKMQFEIEVVRQYW